MNTITIREWLVTHDEKATRIAYEQIITGGAEKCGCDYCLNFAAARERVYPSEVRDLFEQLGIDYRKEAETFHCNREETGLHCYSGWFHFIGSLGYLYPKHAALDRTQILELAPGSQFVWSLSQSMDQCHSVFKNKSLVQFGFAAIIPWVIDIAEPED